MIGLYISAVFLLTGIAIVLYVVWIFNDADNESEY